MSSGAGRRPVDALLAARSVAVVGASERKGSFGERLVTEIGRSTSAPMIYFVNPRYDRIAGRRSYPNLEAVPEPVDLVLLGVPDPALAGEIERAADRGDRAAVIFGAAHGPSGRGPATLREFVAQTASAAGMAVCGGGCMGFVNQVAGLRALGYLERDPLPVGGAALVTHSGSVFSTLLRMERRIGWTLAVSSGQELVTTTASYVDYALDLEQTTVVVLFLEALRDPAALRTSLAKARERDVPVVALTVGSSTVGSSMVAAHSGALAGSVAAWEALFDAYGVLRVHDLAELADTVELLDAGRRVPRWFGTSTGPPRRVGIGTVHDSGAERVHLAEAAEQISVPFAELSDASLAALATVLEPGLEPGNPLDVWGTGRDTRQLFATCLQTLCEDEAVVAVALVVDLVPEFDGDESYPLAVLDVAGRTDKPICVLTGLASALDRVAAGRLREAGVPVLEGTLSGIRALRSLLELGAIRHQPAVEAAGVDGERRARWLARLREGPCVGADAVTLLADYGIESAATIEVDGVAGALVAGSQLGYPVVLKTNDASILHRSDVDGVRLGIAGPGALADAYEEMAARLGPRALVCEVAPEGVELAVGITSDPSLGPVVVVGAGGVLVELLADRVVALPPLDHEMARRLLDRLTIAALLRGYRGRPAVDLSAAAAVVVAVATIAVELGDALDALDINPLRCTPSASTALDAVVLGRA